MKPEIILIESSETHTGEISDFLASKGCTVHTYTRNEPVIEKLRNSTESITVITDLTHPRPHGFELISQFVSGDVSLSSLILLYGNRIEGLLAASLNDWLVEQSISCGYIDRRASVLEEIWEHLQIDHTINAEASLDTSRDAEGIRSC